MNKKQIDYLLSCLSYRMIPLEAPVWTYYYNNTDNIINDAKWHEFRHAKSERAKLEWDLIAKEHECKNRRICSNHEAYELWTIIREMGRNGTT